MASSVIGALRVNLGLDSAQFSRGLKNADGSMQKFAKQARRAATAAATAFAAAGAAMAAAVGRTIAAADRLDDVAGMLGVNVESLQELRHAAEMSGIGIQNFDVALRRFIRRSAEAAQGTGAAKGAFEELGIQLTDSSGRMKDSEVLLAEVADALQKVKDPADKLRLAFKMFDTDGAAMVNMLNRGSVGMAELRQQARDLGIVLSTETTKAADQFDNNLSLLRKSAQGFASRITTAVLPALVSFTDRLVVIASDSKDLVDGLRRVAETAGVAGVALTLAFAPSLLASIRSITVAVGVGLVGALRALSTAALANPLIAIGKAIATAITLIWHFRDAISAAIGVDVTAIFRRAGTVLINSFRGAAETGVFLFQWLRDSVGGVMVELSNIVIRSLNMVTDTVTLMVNGMIAAFNSIPGIVIEPVGNPAKIDEIVNTYAQRLEGAFGRYWGRLGEIMSDDPFGRWADKVKSDLEDKIEPALASSAGAAEDWSARVAAALEAGREAHKALMEAGRRVWEQTRTPAERYAETIKELNLLLQAGAVDAETYGRAVAQAQEEFARATKKVDENAEASRIAFEGWKRSVSDGFADAIVGAKNFGDALKQLLVQLAKVEISSEIFSLLPGGGGAGGSILSGLGKALGFRADGGPVSAGRPYVVGERGPELIVPRSNAQVIPNHELGGTRVVVNQTIAPNFSGNAATRQEVLEIAAMTQQATLAALPNHIKRGGSYAQAIRGR